METGVENMTVIIRPHPVSHSFIVQGQAGCMLTFRVIQTIWATLWIVFTFWSQWSFSDCTRLIRQLGHENYEIIKQL